ncbi:TonB family protein [Larkinella arboricola]
MNAVLDYFLKANLFLVLFYACYWLWLRKHTFFRLNRLYLLASVLLSMVLPFIELPSETVETIPIPVGAFTIPVTITPVEPTGPDWETIGYGFYGLISVILLFRLLIQITGIERLIRRSERHEVDDYTLVLPSDERVPTFSFFRYLVLCRRDAQSANTPIVAHELVHIRQWHSFDVLLLEAVQLVFWLNPVLFLYKQSIQQVHEFLADSQAEDKHQYATFLIDYAFGVQPNTLTNGFFKPSLLKERIIMLHRRTTSRWALGKYVLVLPLLLSLLAMTTARDEISQLVNPVSDEKITVSGKVTDQNGQPLPGATVVVQNGTIGAQTDAQGQYKVENIPANATLVASFVGFESQKKAVAGKKTLDFELTAVVKSLDKVVVVAYASNPTAKTAAPKKDGFTVVEQMPEFPGGKQALGQYLATNLRYPADARQNNTDGTVYVQFVIGTDGTVYNIRVQKGIGSGCDEEAVRVVGKMPAWKPGIQGGKPVAVPYVLPIEFQLEKDEPTPTPRRTGDLKINFDRANPVSNDPDKQPLYVVDGEKMTARSIKSGFPTNLPPHDIQEINVLKGASATSLYGDEGKNGVIHITTRQKAMTETLQRAGRVQYDGKPPVYMLDDKIITPEAFRKLNPDEIESVEADHSKSTYTIKATTKH